MKRNCGLLALSLGLAFTLVAPALAISDKVETQRTLMERGYNNGKPGYWVEYTTKTYRFVEDPAMIAVRDAFKAAFGREPNQAELDNYLALKALGSGMSDRDLAVIAANVASGKITIAGAKAQIAALAALADQNKNSNYPNNLPSAFLQSGGAISYQTANAVGAWGWGAGWGVGNNVEVKITNAFKAAGIDPYSKRMPSGQTLSGNFSTMMSQLKAAGIVTLDWNFPQLLADIGGGQTLLNMANARGASLGWGANQANLFHLNNMNDPTLQHDWSAGLGGATGDWDDATVRSWISTYDGIGHFNNRGDVDFYMAMTYSSAAKLVAESKALRALGFTAQADQKIVAARNVILLTGNNHDPLVLDLNGNGKIDVTGRSSAKYRNASNQSFVKNGSVKFDLLANGKAIQTEWIKDGDGFLVDNRKNAALDAIKAGKNLTGANLFGDVEGYPGGFLKLGMNFDQEAKYAADKKIQLSIEYGSLKGKELENLMVWVDNGDGIATRGELKTLPELGITELSVRPVYKDANGETLEQAYFVRNGQKHLIQEVWFMGE